MGGLFISTVAKENVARVENCEQLSAASHLSFSRKRLADALDRAVDDGFDQFLLTTDRRWIEDVGGWPSEAVLVADGHAQLVFHPLTHDHGVLVVPAIGKGVV